MNYGCRKLPFEFHIKVWLIGSAAPNRSAEFDVLWGFIGPRDGLNVKKNNGCNACFWKLPPCSSVLKQHTESSPPTRTVAPWSKWEQETRPYRDHCISHCTLLTVSLGVKGHGMNWTDWFIRPGPRATSSSKAVTGSLGIGSLDYCTRYWTLQLWSSLRC